MGNGLTGVLEGDSAHTSVDGATDLTHRWNISRSVAILANLVVVPFGYGAVPDTVVSDAKKRLADARVSMQHYAEPIFSFFDELVERRDRIAERRAALRQLRKRGYVVRDDEVYYPTETRLDGTVINREERLIGKLLFDGSYNRAEILWEHHPKLERKLREIGYVSVAPVNKV